MVNLILFGSYLLIIFIIIGFLAIFFTGISKYKKYSKYITPVMRIYLIIIFCIAIFGGYMTLTGTLFPSSQKTIQRVNL